MLIQAYSSLVQFTCKCNPSLLECPNLQLTNEEIGTTIDSRSQDAKIGQVYMKQQAALNNLIYLKLKEYFYTIKKQMKLLQI